MGINTVSLVISETPNVLVRSLNVPTTVNCRPVQLDHLPHGVLHAAVQADRQLLGEHHHMLAIPHVAGIDEMSRKQHHVPHLGVMLIGADDRHVLLLAVDQQPPGIGHYAGGRNDSRAELLPNGFHIGHFDEVGIHFGGAVGAGRVLRVNQVGSNAADQVQDIVAAGDGNGHHQNDRSVTDHQPQRRQETAEFVGAQGLQAEPKRFSDIHQAPEASLRSFSACWREGSPGVRLLCRYWFSRALA